MEQSKKRKNILSIIGVLILVMGVFGISRAFFNYTRTGSANTISTGQIHFNSTQSNTLEVTNLFPMTETEAKNSGNNTVSIRVIGDTNYENGLEYLITAEDVNIETSTGKKVPLSVTVSVTGNGLGTASTTGYFTTDRGHSTSYYKLLNNDVLKDGDYLLVGYIAPFTGSTASGVDGTIDITAYLDEEKIAVTDTLENGDIIVPGYTNGTTSTWVDGRTVLTTPEWNSLRGNSALSFKIRVESNEGIWVEEPMSRNDMKYPTEITSIRSSITEINFIKIPEERINTHANLIDLTASGGQGVVKAWIEGTKLYIASPGETYFPSVSSGLFYGFNNVTKFNFNNVNTSLVTSMLAMFSGNTSLTSIDISSFDTSNVTDMQAMFDGCTNLTSIDLSNLDTSNVTLMGSMFRGCSGLTSIDLSNLDTSNVTDMSVMFGGCSSLTSIDLSHFNTSAVTNMESMFYNCSSLTSVNLSGLGSNG